MIDQHFENLRIYQDHATVAAYAGQDGLTAVEQELFDAYIGEGCDILDIGVGGGRTTRYLAGRARTYVGIDYSEPMIDSCRRRFPRQEFRLVDASDMSQFEDGSFDAAVFSFNGLGYLYPDERRLQCMREIVRVLRPNGILIFSLHNSRSLFVRPSRRGTSVRQTLAGVSSAVTANLRRAGQRITSRAFWSGSGYVRSDVHGGLTFFLATPVVVYQELGMAGLRPLTHVPEDAGRKSARFVTRWYYYVASRLPHP